MKARLMPALLIACMAFPASATTPEADEAKAALSKSQTCSIGGLGPIQDLIKKYGSSTDPDVKAVVAQARYDEGFVYWFREDYGYKSRLSKVIELYDHESDPRLASIASEARLLMEMLEKNHKKQMAYIKPILDRYKDSDDVGLAYAYVKALDALSGIKRDNGDIDEANRLYAEAGRILAKKVQPFLKKSDPSEEAICI